MPLSASTLTLVGETQPFGFHFPLIAFMSTLLRVMYFYSVLVGLKQAVETVNDYNPLMKDFPLNDLLSASELDKIRQALMAIFTHLKKIRNTKYPIQRALRLVEAISRDLSSQLLKVLGTRKLMHVAYEEFEKVHLKGSHNTTLLPATTSLTKQNLPFLSAGYGGLL